MTSNLEKIISYRDRVQDVYFDACVDENFTVEQLQQLRNRLEDLEEYIQRITCGIED
jgi:hypothetical protein